ncbi:plasmid replication protein RepC [Tianweitania sediminis]|uniref:Replication initiation protein RepC n=1 Tax=Tianweitania sediminis TaxID=1502156 RepID=A0A8J7R3P3_9HYPH|nr:plasmid replication protein RepC [Tianweitania sediminis]MBP0440398.1 replication initiation protein RepC [Tianweitania sediminis]
MITHLATTPFGARPMSLGLISSQLTAKEVKKDATVSKWRVFGDIREAKDALGATDRALAILDALLSFHRGDELTAQGGLVVFPSNKLLIRRANGMSPATLRRHLAVLVTCGLVIRRDSPNGKRYARKGQNGEIEQAYGFDLSPIVARAEEFENLAAAAQAEQKAFKLAKERLTICRRDIVKMIDAGINESVPGNWRGFLTRYETIVSRLPRTPPRQVLDAIVAELEELWADVHETLETFVKSEDSNANESHSDRHIQNSNPDFNSTDESEHRYGKINEASGSAEKTDNVRNLPKRELTLGVVLNACPEIANFSRSGPIRMWRDLAAAADVARPTMGISPSAWQEAVEVMGPDKAAVTVAAILQRADQINSKGGYLRTLTERARNDQFSVWPMVMALLNARMERMGSAAGAVEMPERGQGGSDGGGAGHEKPTSIEISSALAKTMKGKGWK